jgi:hypothetical protein
MGGKQARFTPATRQKLSELNVGDKNPFYGKHHSEEARRAIGDAARKRMIEHHPTKGRPISQAHRNKQSTSMRKRWADPAYKVRLCEAHKSRLPRVRKLANECIPTIQARLAAGELGYVLAQEYGVSKSMISAIKTGQY